MKGDFPLNKQKISREEEEKAYSMPLAITGVLAIAFFIATLIVLSWRFSSSIFNMGAFFCIVAATENAIRKVRVALKKKEIDFFNTMFVPLMILGLALMVIGSILSVRYGYVTVDFLKRRILSFPVILFLILGAIGLLIRGLFALEKGKKIFEDKRKYNIICHSVNLTSQILLFFMAYFGFK